jgi:hypothetical protein
MDKYVRLASLNLSKNKKKHLVLFLLVFIFSLSNIYANSRYGGQNRYRRSLAISFAANVYQIKMLTFENSIEQKFMESAYRMSLGKYFSEGFKVEASYIAGLNSIGPLFDNSTSSSKYIRIYNTRTLMLAGTYDYYINSKSFLSPKLGLGRMTYKEFYDGSLNESINQSNDTEFINVGIFYNYELFKNFTLQSGGEYFIGKTHLKFPMLSFGINYIIPATTLKSIARNCPSFF